jgi:hypothetical protein
MIDQTSKLKACNMREVMTMDQQLAHSIPTNTNKFNSNSLNRQVTRVANQRSAGMPLLQARPKCINMEAKGKWRIRMASLAKLLLTTQIIIVKFLKDHLAKMVSTLTQS